MTFTVHFGVVFYEECISKEQIKNVWEKFQITASSTLENYASYYQHQFLIWNARFCNYCGARRNL